jgi:hypothetical protein
VGRLQSLSNTFTDRDSSSHRVGRFHNERVGQRRARDELHHDEVSLAVRACVENGHDVGMIQARGRAGLLKRADVELGDPLVDFVKPDAGDKLNGSVSLSGWALDRYTLEGTPAGAQISKVELFLDGSTLGEATLGAASPEGTQDRYGVANAGWSHTWDASAVAVGEHTLTARAHSSAQPGSWNEAIVLVIVEEPKVEGNGCGWLVGTARGAAVETLQAGWQTFHTATQAYRSKMETVDKTKRVEFSGAVDVTKSWLETRRNVALAELHAKADEYLALCLAGQLPSPVTVTYPQDVIATAHLLYEYRSIVDKAMVDMRDYFATRKPVLEAY